MPISLFFRAGYTLDAAESIFSRTITNRSVSDLITSLLDKSLLQRTYDVRGELRFDLLVTIQQFALDRLRRTGEEAEARNWHLAYFLDLAEQTDKEIHGPDQVKWLDRLEIEHDNFCAALEWCVAEQNTEAGLRLLSALGGSWIGRNRLGEIRSWFDKICALPKIGDYPALYGRLLNHLGRVNWLVGDYREARSVLEEGQDLWLQMGMAGERRLAETLVFLGMVARSCEADYKVAQVFFGHSFELYQQHGDQWGVAFALFNLGINAAGRNDDVSALALLGRSLELFRQLGDLWGIARVSQSIGEQFLRQGKQEKARLYFEQHLMIDEGLHFRTGTVVALGNLGELYRHQGDDDRAIEFYEKSLVMSREYGLKGDWNFAEYSLGMIALHQNDYPLARQRFTDYFKLARTIYEKFSACDLLTGLAAVAAGTSQPERAAKLHGAAQAIFETTDYQISPFNRAEFDRHMEIAREQLGEERFAALQAEGRALTLEQAIELAL